MAVPTAYSMQLTINIIEAHDLLPLDRGGTSDPYVKVKLKKPGEAESKRLYQTIMIPKNLNPVWNEKFQVQVDKEDVEKGIVRFRVFDHNALLRNEFMGQATVLLSDLQLGVQLPQNLPIEGKETNSGILVVELLLERQPEINPGVVISAANQQEKQRSVFESALPLVQWAKEQDELNYVLGITIMRAEDLPAMDYAGLGGVATSDPYVKLRLGEPPGKMATVFRTKTIIKNLNPTWNEVCNIADIDSVMISTYSLRFCVYDYDRGSADDFIGMAELRLSDLLQCSQAVGSPIEHNLKLSTAKSNAHIVVRTIVKTRSQFSAEQTQQQIISAKTSTVKQQQQRIVQVVVDSVEETDSPKAGTYYVKVGCGADYKRTNPNSTNEKNGVLAEFLKHAATTNQSAINNQFLSKRYVRFNEELLFFQARNADDLVVELHLSHDHTICGRTKISLSKLSVEQTHKFHLIRLVEQACGNFRVKMTVTLTGFHADALKQAVTGLHLAPTSDPIGKELFSQENTAKIHGGIFKPQLVEQLFKESRKVAKRLAGLLVIRVLSAKHLRPADLTGKSDPFCLVEVGNVRLRTNAIQKTLNPEWNRTFVIPVEDITASLELTILDTDRIRHKEEFLGKVAIPLLNLRNGPEQRFSLKNRRLLTPSSPRGEINIQCTFVYSNANGFLNVLSGKKENKYTEKQPSHVVEITRLKRDIQRFVKLSNPVLQAKAYSKDIIEWRNFSTSAGCVIAWIFLVLTFQTTMIPLALTVIAMASMVYQGMNSPNFAEEEPDLIVFSNDATQDSMNLPQKLAQLEVLCVTGQALLGQVDALGERFKNLISWKNPWISTVMSIMVAVVAWVLYFVPFRWVILSSGLYVLTKKKLQIHGVFLYNLLTRVQNDQ